MMKKIVMLSTLVSTLLYADVKEKGFFVGLDFGDNKANVDYRQVGTATNAHTVESDATSVSPKIGYQYYFTRVYASANKMNYQEERGRYTIEETHYEFNADYIPILYQNFEKDLAIKAIMGVSLGYSYNNLRNISQEDQLLPVDPVIAYDYEQEYFNYGYQLGFLLVGKDGVSVEVGFKSRMGTLLEFQDDSQGTNRATFNLDAQEYYMGFNYLF